MLLKVLLIIILIAICVLGGNLLYCILQDRRGERVSFKDTLNQSEMPVISLYNGDTKLNFLLDTGSNCSHICSEAAKNLNGVFERSQTKVTGFGEGESNGIYNVTLKSNDTDYNVKLYVSDNLTSAFKSVESETGVRIDGILGNQFFKENKYVLDFNELTLYSKK